MMIYVFQVNEKNVNGRGLILLYVVILRDYLIPSLKQTLCTILILYGSTF